MQTSRETRDRRTDRETDQQNTSKQPYRVNPVSFTNMIIITIIRIINRETELHLHTYTWS